MTYDDDDLDRALAALPLEEPPSGFRARVVAATVYAPARVATPVRSLEPWLLGTLCALLAWCCWLVVAQPHAVLGALAPALDAAPLVSPQTWVWTAVGAAATLWISVLTVPAGRGASRR